MTLHTRCTGNTARMFQCCFKNSIMLFHWLFNCFLFYATVSSCVMKTVFEPLGWTRHMALILVEHINFQQPFQKTERRRLWGNAFSESNPPLVQRFRSKKWFPPAATLPFGMIIYTYIYIYTHSMLWPFWLLSCVCLTPSFSVAFSVLLCPSLSLFPSPSISSSTSCGHHASPSAALVLDSCCQVSGQFIRGFLPLCLPAFSVSSAIWKL